jgi:hypothetical protein
VWVLHLYDENTLSTEFLVLKMEQGSLLGFLENSAKNKEKKLAYFV